jgi:hypothetical protein
LRLAVEKEEIMSREQTTKVRNIVVTLLFGIGLIISVLSLLADYIGLDLTPGFGVLQMVALLIGMTCITIALYGYVYGLRGKGAPRSLQADIGVRLGATGLVLAYVAGLSDLIGIGTHVQPHFERPYVGPLQIGGMSLGILCISIGLHLYYTSRNGDHDSSMNFIAKREDKNEVGSGK